MDRDLEEKAGSAAQGPARLHRHHQVRQRRAGPRRPASRSAPSTRSSTTPSWPPRCRPAAQGRGPRGLHRGAAQEDPHPAREVAALAPGEPADGRAPGGRHRLGGEDQALLQQAAAAAGSQAVTRAADPARPAAPRTSQAPDAPRRRGTADRPRRAALEPPNASELDADRDSARPELGLPDIGRDRLGRQMPSRRARGSCSAVKERDGRVAALFSPSLGGD